MASLNIHYKINANTFNKAVEAVKGFFAADNYAYAGALAA